MRCANLGSRARSPDNQLRWLVALVYESRADLGSREAACFMAVSHSFGDS